jgi:hypothetical protein
MSAYLVYPSNSGGSGALAAKIVSLSTSASQSVVYGAAVPSGSVPVIGDVFNTVDANPIFLQSVITAYSTTGFTILFNVAPDTTNYQLSYIVVAPV